MFLGLNCSSCVFGDKEALDRSHALFGSGPLTYATVFCHAPVFRVAMETLGQQQQVGLRAASPATTCEAALSDCSDCSDWLFPHQSDPLLVGSFVAQDPRTQPSAAMLALTRGSHAGRVRVSMLALAVG